MTPGVEGRAARRSSAALVAWCAGGGLAALALAALAAPWVAPHDPVRVDLGAVFAGRSGSHLLGTDQVGRDVLSRLVHGARWSLGGAAVVTAVVTAVGVTVGAVSGWVGGFVDSLLMRVVDALLAFPSLLLALAVVAVVGPGLAGVLVALASVGWASYARVVRGQVLSLRERDYVEAARAAGASPPRLLVRHVLPHVASPVVVLATLDVGQLVLALAGLSFLGLGAQPPTPEWGAMLNEGRGYLFTHPELMVYPGAAITLTVLACNLLGDRVRDLLDARSSGEEAVLLRRRSWTVGGL